MIRSIPLFVLLLVSLMGNSQGTGLSSPREYPVLWQQTAAEYRALCYQAFNLAKLRLEQIRKKRFRKEKLAIITDLDETILDNSYSEAQLIKDGKEYSSMNWKDWTSRAQATAVPGAAGFLRSAKERGASIFYISNRDTSELASTLINLQKLQLPDAELSHMLFLSGSSSKETRRQAVMKDYTVIMLLGDNLNDFTQAFEKKSIDERRNETDKQQEEWGRKFIVLPNATYGEWENAIYDYERNPAPAWREAKRKEKLKGYK